MSIKIVIFKHSSFSCLWIYALKFFFTILLDKKAHNDKNVWNHLSSGDCFTIWSGFQITQEVKHELSNSFTFEEIILIENSPIFILFEKNKK